MDALIIISLHTKLEISWILTYFGTFFPHQMTPLHLAVESNRIKMVECLLDQGADTDLQDDKDVILHTNAVDYLQLAGRYWTYSLLFEHKILSLQASKLGSDL